MRKLLIFSALILSVGTAFGQHPSVGASQSTMLSLSDAIDISFTTLNVVNMQFNTVNDYANGVESGDNTILIRSNKKYNVRVKTQASKFAYSGPTSPAPVMKVNPILKLKITSNNTGGSVSSGYANYKSPSTGGSKIINNAPAGGNSTFKVKYFADPGFNYPAGTYSVDIIYTATQA